MADPAAQAVVRTVRARRRAADGNGMSLLMILIVSAVLVATGLAASALSR
jgi:hypothetical protein